MYLKKNHRQLQISKKKQKNQFQFQVVVLHEKMFVVLVVVVVLQPDLVLLVHVYTVDVAKQLYLLQLRTKKIIQH
jgi:hypothetical protein